MRGTGAVNYLLIDSALEYTTLLNGRAIILFTNCSLGIGRHRHAIIREPANQTVSRKCTVGQTQPANSELFTAIDIKISPLCHFLRSYLLTVFSPGVSGSLYWFPKGKRQENNYNLLRDDDCPLLLSGRKCTYIHAWRTMVG